MSLSTMLDQPILSLSTEGIGQLKQADINDLGNMWNVFNKCKNHLANGNRLEYMSWRLWQFQRRHQEQEKKKSHQQQEQHVVTDSISVGQQQEQVPIKQYISNFLSSSTHDVHEVTQSFQKHQTSSSSSSTTSTSSYSSLPTVHNQMQDIEWTPTNKTTLNDNKNTKNLSSAYDTQQQQQQQKQYDSQRCSQITSATQSIRMITPPLEQQTQIIKQDEIDYDDDYQDDDDYFLSDDDDDDDDYFYYHKRKNNDIDFVNDFKKTQPRPTPRRSLLSDLIQKQCMISSNPTYCSSSNIKTFEQDLSQSLRDSIHRESLSDQEYSQKNAVHTKKRDLQPSWLESFHGW